MPKSQPILSGATAYAARALVALFCLMTAFPAQAQEPDGKDFPKLLVERECMGCDFSGLPLQQQGLLGIVARDSDFPAQTSVALTCAGPTCAAPISAM